MLSIKDIANEAGVSVSTVSRVLNSNGYVSKDKREKVEMVIEKHNYRPSSLARSLVTKTSRQIGLLIPHIDNPFFIAVITGVEQYARQKGYNMLLCLTNEDVMLEKEFLDILEAQRVAGIIAVPVGTDSQYYLPLMKTIPIVFLGRHFNDISSSYVDMNNKEASYNAVKHLCELGHRNILIINNPLNMSAAIARWEGAKQALEEYGLPVDPAHIVEVGYNILEASRSVKKALSENKTITAIYACHNLPALGAIKAVKEMGLSIPDDIAIAAFNGNDDSSYNCMFTPPLSANIHPSEELAKTAVDLLWEMIDHKNQHGTMSSNNKQIIFNLTFSAKESSCRKTKI